MSNEELYFSVFCIESLADKLNMPANRIFDLLTVNSNVLYQYIIPCYASLHTQGKEYIMNDICSVLKDRGVNI